MPTKSPKQQTMEKMLANLPDTGLSKGKTSNEAAEYVAAHPENWNPIVLPSRGRPKRGQETGSITKSIRFPEEAWDIITKKAKRQNLPVHAAMRKAVMDWASKPDEVAPPAPAAQAPIVSFVVSAGDLPSSWLASDARSYMAFMSSDQGPGALKPGVSK